MVRALPSVDYRVVERIQGSSQMRAEQGSGWLSQYGGPSGFRELDSPGLGDVYNAVVGGATTEELPVWTGLSNGDISGHLKTLEKMGLIAPVGMAS